MNVENFRMLDHVYILKCGDLKNDGLLTTQQLDGTPNPNLTF
jgi:hypothetical protein